MKRYSVLFRLFNLVKEKLPMYTFASLGVSLRNLAIVFVNAYIVANVVINAKNGNLHAMLTESWIILLLLLCFALIDSSFQYLHNNVTHDMIIRIREIAFSSILNCDMYKLGKYGNRAEIISRLNRDTDLIQQVVKFQLLTPTMYIISGIGATISIMAVNYGWIIVLVTYCLASVVLMIQTKLAVAISKLQATNQEAHRSTLDTYVHSISKSLSIKLLGHADYIMNQYTLKAREEMHTANRMGIKSSLNDLIGLSSKFIQYIGAIIIGVLLCANEKMTLEQVVFVAPLSGLIVNMVTQLGNSFISLQRSMIGIQRILQIIELEQEDKRDNGIKDIIHVDKAVEIRHLSFNYYNDKEILRDIAFDIYQKEIVALVGESGIGKSTIAKIIMGLYPYRGVCKVFGTDINLYDLDFLRTLIAYIPQNSIIVSGTVRDNLLLGAKAELDDQYIIEILRTLGSYKWIEDIGGIYRCINEDGVSLSGGQIQSLGIARALFCDAKIVIFDETLSAIDADQKMHIMKVLKCMCKSTVIIITHDRDIIQKCDRTIALDS